MEDQPLAPETTTRRSKRKTNGASTENQERTSDASDQMEPSGHREHSPDDFEEIRPKTKRSRASEGTAASAQSIELSLIEVIKGNGKLIPQVVKLWVERYEKDAKPAIAELLTMLFEACGAKYYLQGESLDEIDVDDVVVALVNLARRVS